MVLSTCFLYHSAYNSLQGRRSRINCDMVQKSSRPQLGRADASVAKRPRGRPRAYDPEAALRRVLEPVGTKVYPGAWLDDVAAATGMNRPSLYAAFGDKQALYLRALESYWEQSLHTMRKLLARDEPLAV